MAEASKERRLVYRYLALPYLTRLKVARNIDLLEKHEDGNDAATWRKVLQRAKDQNKLAALWDEITIHGRDREIKNPFLGGEDEDYP